MDRTTETGLIRRVLDHLESGTRDMAAATKPGPVAEYFDAVRFTREREVLFRDTPLIVGHLSQVADPGDFFTHDAAGVPILVVRDAGGRLRAFLNVCRHRGAIVCTAKRGSGARRFACPYHAWVYDADGRLLDIPDAVGFDDCDTAKLGLTALPVAERHGFVWVRPRPRPGVDIAGDAGGGPGADLGNEIDAFLGPLGAELAALDLASHTVFQPAADPAPTEVRRRMNWKLMVDTFLEGYHFKYAHPKSVYPLFLDNRAVFDRFEPHIRWIMPKRTIRDLAGTPEADWRLRDHAFVMYYVFPNTMIVAVGDHVATFIHFPIAPDEAVMLLDVLIPAPAKSEKAVAHWEKNQAMLLGAINEDFIIGEGMQRGYRAGAQDHLTYGRYEHAIAWFHDSVNRVLAARNDPGEVSIEGRESTA